MASFSTAMLLVGPRQFTKTRLRVPDVARGGWLAIESTAISGVEVQAWKGITQLVRYPLIPGHEVVGRIAADPDGAFGLPLGTRVVVEGGIRCNECERCRNGLAVCTSRRPANAYGRLPSTEAPGLWGGFSEMMYLDPGARVHPVSDGLPAAVTTFAHALADARTWAVEIPNLSDGDTVLVLGPGPRGIAATVAAREAGASWVGVAGLGHDGDRLDLASRLGADTTIDVDRADLASSVADSLGRRPDIVIDVTSHDSEIILQALDIVRPGGTVVLASTKGTNAIENLFSDIIVMKELTIRGAYGATSSAYDWACAHLSQDGRLDAMVTHEFPLDEADRAILASAGELGREELLSVAVTL